MHCSVIPYLLLCVSTAVAAYYQLRLLVLGYHQQQCQYYISIGTANLSASYIINLFYMHLICATIILLFFVSLMKSASLPALFEPFLRSSIATYRSTSSSQSTYILPFTLQTSSTSRFHVLLQTTFQTAHGQLLDVTTAPIGSVDLSRYTIDTYMRIVTYKTAFYSFYLPCACGMLLGGMQDDESYKVA